MRNITLKVGWSLLAILSVLLIAAVFLVALPFIGIGAILFFSVDQLIDWLNDSNPFKNEAPK